MGSAFFRGAGREAEREDETHCQLSNGFESSLHNVSWLMVISSKVTPAGARRVNTRRAEKSTLGIATDLAVLTSRLSCRLALS